MTAEQPAPLVAPGRRFRSGTVLRMTVPPRGGRTRRGGGPGWVLLTSLLVLAILASSTLVFTNRVELLRLAVILSLWAAALAAFVTVMYRRQSELDQARARDMKHVYDLQLDREISARREYELSVEAHLRRQLSLEVRAQAAEEMSALRAELASLRSHLEVMLGTDLGQRPALESDPIAVPIPAARGRVESSRVRVVAEEVVAVAEETVLAVESPIIDVPEEPLTPLPEPASRPTESAERDRERRGAHRRPGGESAPAAAAPRPYVPPRPDQRPYQPPKPSAPLRPYAPAPAPPPPRQPDVPWRPPETRRGRHSSTDGGRSTLPPGPAVMPEAPGGRHWVPLDGPSAPTGRHRGTAETAERESAMPRPVAPEPAPEPRGQHVGGQSVAELMARLGAGATGQGAAEKGSKAKQSGGKGSGKDGGGGRRRRED